MNWKFAKKLPTLGIHYEPIPGPEPTLPEGLLPNPTQGIDTSLVSIVVHLISALLQDHM